LENQDRHDRAAGRNPAPFAADLRPGRAVVDTTVNLAVRGMLIGATNARDTG
jgi:hypothetical protein